MASDNFPHDAAYKAFFSNPDMVKSLLLDFVPEDFVKDFDFDSLEECSASYITSELRQRHDDIVWRVRWQKAWCYIYILLEFQSSQDYWMPLRILTYTSLLWENLIKQNIIKINEKLPPVFPIVIYNGEGAWKSAKNIEDLIIPLHDKLSDYQPRQKYFLIDENRVSALLLDKAKGKAAYIFRLEQAKTADEILAISHELAKNLKNPKYDFLRRSIYSWISRLLRKRTDISPERQFETMEDAAMLEQRIAQWEEELMQKGILIGEKKGMLIGEKKGMLIGEKKGMLIGEKKGMLIGEEKGKAEGFLLGEKKGLEQQKITLLEMLSDRFDEIPSSWTNIIEGIDDPEVIRQLTKAVYKVKSSHEFGEILKRGSQI